mmetsp:Transcript_56838/g.133512  ORF Transcript_56838/g.133512 Transcript_56838/m.133512 type:complete len:274 (+) Transcript_56838:82-903(+)
MPVSLEVVCHTEHGDSVGIVGEAAALGAWSTDKALHFETDAVHYPKWKLQMPALPAGSEFKLVLFKNDGDVVWEGFWHNRRWPHNPVLNRLVASPFNIVLQGTFGLDNLTILNSGSMQAWDTSARSRDLGVVTAKGEVTKPAWDAPSDNNAGECHDEEEPEAVSRRSSIGSLERVDSIGHRSVKDEDLGGRTNIFPIEEEFAADWEIDVPPSIRGRGLEFDPVMMRGDGVPGACSKSCFEGIYRLLHGLPERPDGEKGGFDDDDVEMDFLRGS